MITNNFNTSTTGINLELTAVMDDDLARIRWDDFKQGSDGCFVDVISCNRYGAEFIAIFADEDEAYSPHFTKRELNAMSKESLYELLINHQQEYNIYNLTKKELVDEAYCITKLDYLKNDFVSKRWNDFGDYEFLVHGYSQGEATKVYLSPKAKKQYSLYDRNYMFNLMHCSPALISLTINDNDEYYLHERLDDEYNYDREEFLAKIKEVNPFAEYSEYHQSVIFNFLEENLPSNLYN